ncbi:hypothetical protein SAMN00120144_3824 [Hymenobacter roseosalivarius DSM 11622]|uniref:Uncharacterized protein n=1 Tax=Hymenobacter roseosalivarius DSM 11622 TaxID=645990 RepID=A0A1W1VZB6_9BACT|nr:hypothetical protein [Hymenobacter roseosalivarius]SMB98613.1 hypothetical protein SAMN00120144_3824 [Hymenobacter roseosalivarius DSM 11622]
MVLCSPTRQLMHWVLPGPAQRLLDGLPYYLLCEAAASVSLPNVEVDTGECTVAEAREENLSEALDHCVEAGHLLLRLHGRNLEGDFTLARLSPDSHIWRFSVGHAAPHSVVLHT